MVDYKLEPQWLRQRPGVLLLPLVKIECWRFISKPGCVHSAWTLRRH